MKTYEEKKKTSRYLGKSMRLQDIFCPKVDCNKLALLNSESRKSQNRKKVINPKSLKTCKLQIQQHIQIANRIYYPRAREEQGNKKKNSMQFHDKKNHHTKKCRDYFNHRIGNRISNQIGLVVARKPLEPTKNKDIIPRRHHEVADWP